MPDPSLDGAPSTPPGPDDRNAFLAYVSHELRSPLNAIRGWAHLLRKAGPLTPPQAHALDAIERSVSTQSRLIEDLLDSQRLQGGDGALRMQRVDLESVLREAIEVVQPSLDERRQDLLVRARSQPVDVDADRLRQVLVNLLTNAVKFTPACGRIEVLAERRGEWMAIEVTDNGIGLAPEWVSQAFEPFRQGAQADRGRHGGLGLGLTLARRLVELHGGRLSAHSAGPGRGSTFLIELPLPAQPRARVVIVEDDDDTRCMLEHLLREQGYDTAAFSRSADAFNYLAGLPSEATPRLIVSDIGMPDEDGCSFIRRVHAMHADRNAKSPPAVAVTGFTSDAARHRALDAGFEAHLPKPVDPNALQTTVERLLQAGRTQPVP
jgi:CheY-like chemotaxis protein/anti-sigma regulatory factor (Ser/Thr protein kinase)